MTPGRLLSPGIPARTKTRAPFHRQSGQGAWELVYAPGAVYFQPRNGLDLNLAVAVSIVSLEEVVVGAEGPDDEVGAGYYPLVIAVAGIQLALELDYGDAIDLAAAEFQDVISAADVGIQRVGAEGAVE